MQAIQRGESPVVAVMPTSRGKSMLFMVPAFTAPRGTTIVVVPLIALQADMTRRCQELSISCVPWESRQPPNAASIMLVTPKSAVSPDFQTFLNRLRWTRRLDRIVINKCHVVLNSQHNFQPQMAQLGWLVQARTQIQMKYDQATMTIYRAQTSRPNVAYQVWQPDMTRVGRGLYQWIKSEVVVAFIQDHIRQAAGGKVIIYANIIRQVTAMAQVLRCKAYYSEQLDKAGVLARFIGASPVIATTSALGMGVDIPNIRSIIHIGTPWTLLDYAQESGRAGRDGQHSEAIIIQPAGWDTPAPWMEGVAPKDQEQVAEYIGVVEGIGCHQVMLDQYLDGVVDGYQQQYYQDADPREQICDGYDPN
ncbi:P-loop containing nucleoside triphosphate hydrolase protein [Aspergillus novofumigatus IBT 16806]|uniref:DNA 3'-5' helicase n=1 Tax=Aspergillus novofumigatus (strain IBT 16806) TaxID=1392255 RepID=A0A2I1BS63_ASPN1|nr:P-loop containing nucleoside triphosphate hydrolase protein [Aspergillus novofumigatus IBT 16806]PKX88229.1 P-loop containing nucleoside triphosphate hydrolase protein [Aspergillus novofumigatus IBT 16806]